MRYISDKNFDMIYDMIYDMIDMIRYDMMIYDMMWCDIWQDMIYLLTAIGLPPGDSSREHIYTQTINRMTQNQQYIEQHKNFRENQNTHFVFSNLFFENPAGYEIMWKKYFRAKQATDDNILRRMRIACWIQTHTQNI